MRNSFFCLWRMAPIMLISFIIMGCEAPQIKPFTLDLCQNKPKVVLHVGDVTVHSDLTKYDRLPHIESKMPIPPEKALSDWAQNRFYAANMSSPVTAVVTIQEAYMIQTVEPQNWYTLDNITYKLTYALSLDFKKEGQTVHHQDLKGWESVSIPKRSSLIEKEAAWQKMMNAMIQKIDHQIISGIPTEFKAK